jgi:hypothetical protein
VISAAIPSLSKCAYRIGNGYVRFSELIGIDAAPEVESTSPNWSWNHGFDFTTPQSFCETPVMKRFLPSLFCLVALALCSFTGPYPALGQGDADVEAKFIAMLKNATLKGSWAPISQGRLGGERGDDGYRIARVEKGEGGKWSIVSVFTVRDRQIEFPISASVKFAGDTAVLILDNVRAGPGRANWSARVMFHDDVYAGRWWETANREHGGTINGTVTRAEGDAPQKQPAR